MNLPQGAQENIIKLLGIESLPDEQKILIVEKIVDLAQKRLTLRLMESLSEEQGKQFENLLTEQNQQRIQEFMQRNAPSFPDWIGEEVLKIKRELAGRVQDILKE
ncbi:MAG: hypothetical protein HY336_00955 [Candidatus Doudnabacteria bacterium]|nr:hypothetical protein [Candidatus Doudnabacteria bacterium]